MAEEKKQKVGWERILAMIIGATLLVTGIIRNDFAIMVLGAGSFGIPGVIKVGTATNGSRA